MLMNDGFRGWMLVCLEVKQMFVAPKNLYK